MPDEQKEAISALPEPSHDSAVTTMPSGGEVRPLPVDIAPSSSGGGGRLFLLLLLFASGVGALYYFEAVTGLAPGTWWQSYAIVAVLGLVSLLLLWGGIRGRREAAEDMLRRAGALDGSGLALEEGDGRLVYANRRFMEFLARCGAETKEESGVWTLYVFAEETATTAAVKKLRDSALRGVAAEVEVTLPRAGLSPMRIQVAAAPGGPGEVVWSSRDVTAEAGLEAMHGALAGLRNQFETVPVGMAVVDAEGCVIECNPACRDLIGCLDPVGRPITEFVRETDRSALERRFSGNADSALLAIPVDVEIEDAGHRVATIYFSRLPESPDGEAPSSGELALHLIDTTEKKKLEVQFSQSQKMQAVGQLAGGIAHDFNNLLTAMIGFCDLLLQRYQPGEQSFADIMQIKQNANRGARLVRQLLAFSRQQTLQPRVLDVTDVLAELSNLLNRLLGESIELKFVHGRDLGRVKVDQGQLEQVIINLAVNARDAMPRGGNLTISTRNSSLLSEIDRAHSELMPAGDYVMITVADNGVGMSSDLLDRIFDPFFTTKEVGSGTGLGLATVYGIIKQTGGFIFAESDGHGKGSTFTIYLQRYSGEEEDATIRMPAEGSPAGKDLTGGGTILLVEDEDPVRLFGARALRSKGYRVIEARNGESAIELLNDEPIDLLITDMVMPKVDGPAVIAHARHKMPQLPVICISGYAQESVLREVKNTENVSFLAKPFSLKQLAGKVKDVLEDGV